ATWTSTALPSSDAMTAALNANTTARTKSVITAAEGPVTAAHSGAAIRAGLCIRTARRHAEHDSHTSTRTTPDFAGFVTLSLSCDAKLPLRPPLAGPPGAVREGRGPATGPDHFHKNACIIPAAWQVEPARRAASQNTSPPAR